MRSDLAKLTTEKERHGSRNYSLKYGGRVRVHSDPEHDYPTEVGGFRSSSRHRVWGYDAKSFSDVLNPLRGAVRKNVGRIWDDVFSEFCQVLDRRSNSGHHIWTHLMELVQVNTFMLGGEIYECPKYTKYQTEFSKVEGYYVHPLTGILEYKARPTKAESLRRVVDVAPIPVPEREGWFYKNLKGIWFRTFEEKRPFRYYTMWESELRERRKKDWKAGYRLESCTSKEIAGIKKLMATMGDRLIRQ